jgi:hypothetical protein
MAALCACRTRALTALLTATARHIRIVIETGRGRAKVLV